jgi:hypothetical protein
MEFEIGNLVVLNEKGKKFFLMSSNDPGPVFIVSVVNKDSKRVYGHPLGYKAKIQNTISSRYHRMATESEVKTYKIKNMFNEKRVKNGI